MTDKEIAILKMIKSKCSKQYGKWVATTAYVESGICKICGWNYYRDIDKYGKVLDGLIKRGYLRYSKDAWGRENRFGVILTDEFWKAYNSIQ